MAASSAIVSATGTHDGVGSPGNIDRMRAESRTFWSNTIHPGGSLGNVADDASNTPNAFGKSLYGMASLAKRSPCWLTTSELGIPRAHSNWGTIAPSRVMSGSNIAGWPQYETMLASSAPLSIAITSPSPTLPPGDSG